MKTPRFVLLALGMTAVCALSSSGCAFVDDQYAAFSLSERFFDGYAESWEDRDLDGSGAEFKRDLWRVFAVPVCYPFVLAADALLLPGAFAVDSARMIDRAHFDAHYVPSHD